MEIKFINRSFWQRLLGIPATSKPQNADSWQYTEGKLIIDLEKTPEIGTSGSAVRFEGGSLPQRVLLVRGEDDQFLAYQNRCTHLGHRRLDLVPGTDTIQCCSINKSTYDVDGNNIYGPAPKRITTYPAHRDGNKVVVTIR